MHASAEPFVHRARCSQAALTSLTPFGLAGAGSFDAQPLTSSHVAITAVVFPRTASGNVRPKRTIRNAPKDTPTCGFTNASAAAYDSKRDEILVPN